MITFAVEHWSDVREEASALWRLHWAEVGFGKEYGWELDPDIGVLNGLEQIGKLHCVIARSSGCMIGYHASIIEPLIHYKQILAAKSDLYWLHPDWRVGRNAVRLFQAVEQSAKARGVKLLMDGTKTALDRGELFEFLGYTMTEKKYCKCIS